jgi:hypothetical protein
MKGMTPKTVPDKKSSGDKSQETMISTEQANFFRALGQYRIAWLGKLKTEGGDGVSGGMVKLAAGFVILQAIADGIQKIVSILAEASPLLRAEIKVLKIAIGEFLRPIGDLLGTVLRPISFAMLKSNAFARRTMAEEGIKQTDLGEYYSRFFASMTNETLGLDMSDSGMLTLADSIEVAGKTYLASMLGITGFLIVVDWDKLKEDFQELQEMWDAIKITPGDIESLTTGLKNMVGPVTILSNAFTNLATPIQSLSNILNSIPGVGGGGSGGNSTLNVGGINIVNNIVGGARDVAEGIGSGIEDGINVARGWTK